MDSEIANELLEELASALQPIEAQNAALLEFIREKGIAKDDELAPYLERAAAASAVQWRAMRVRMARLFASAEKKAEQAAERDKAAEQQRPQSPEKPVQADQHSQVKSSTKQSENLASGRTGTRTENERGSHDEERAERSDREGSIKQEESEKANAGQPKPSSQASDKGAASASRSPVNGSSSRQSSARQSSANQSSDDNARHSGEGRESEDDASNKGEQNVA